ncbi:hypothetical protein B0H16DRAFT_1847966 [Mycena metata]|uniref:Uncharacterized protein n=1 Tax=Mycena metata TaxID=1033252 RepID=A0AAD7IU69_9AGAR|nr:hypothetical protein B0H16DRAFT_1847966 [Mycena metata]
MDLHEEIAGIGVIVERGDARMQELQATRTPDYTSDDDSDKQQTRAGNKKAVKNEVAVEWVTKITETNRVRSQYLAYGNEASIEHVYGNAALFVEVPAAGKGTRA